MTHEFIIIAGLMLFAVMVLWEGNGKGKKISRRNHPTAKQGDTVGKTIRDAESND